MKIVIEIDTEQQQDRETIQELIELLKKNGITATITGREKTPFSIWRKIQNK